MRTEKIHSFAAVCSNLVSFLATNEPLTNSILSSLRSGELRQTSGSIVVSNVMSGFPGIHQFKSLQKAWAAEMPHLNEADVASILETSLASYQIAQERAHTVDTVWTGPDVSGSEVRRTEAVVIEMLSSARVEVLVVGYWLVNQTRQIKSLVDLLIKRARDGVEVKFVLDPGKKPEGPDNLSALNTQWPDNLANAPREVFTWSEKQHKHFKQGELQYDRKLHAKVIVVDQQDALVTSANLTQAGLLGNLEMGLRIKGPKAKSVSRHFNLLIEEGVLQEWKDNKNN